jgi:glucokinase
MIGLVADIGGTHARFALCEGTRGKRPCLSGIAVLACADYPSLADALSAYLAPLPAALRPRQAALAIAGPVSGDRIVVTNHPWSFSLADTRTALGLETLSALNDCTAVSRALPFLAPADVAPLGDFDADPRRMDAQRMGIVAPGTGLGIGGLLRNGTAVWPLPSEGGHASFAPGDQTERDIARILSGQFGHVSNERLLSGPGLRNIYEALCVLHGCQKQPLSAEEIAARAIAETDAICREALDRFCAILGSVAGDLALLLFADIIFVGGGIAPQMIGFLRASAFRARFEDKGRLASRMAAIPTLAITYPHTGLLGAALHLLE